VSSCKSQSEVIHVIRSMAVYWNHQKVVGAALTYLTWSKSKAELHVLSNVARCISYHSETYIQNISRWIITMCAGQQTNVSQKYWPPFPFDFYYPKLHILADKKNGWTWTLTYMPHREWNVLNEDECGSLDTSTRISYWQLCTFWKLKHVSSFLTLYYQIKTHLESPDAVSSN